nr:immunoglobulin light chain junction region [Macaca mulatta]MOW15152.1 immunoglobulin light chain junction region [Macaca mulatta]MOW15202.1 immunoglobulin light chain junction region [Macaca mulatta]MOW15252.1 immunoglobulin light chain junction region [Macaca mulatta]MOW15373.1 immunoglobulin light chain junction region [Macaca mulatta]
DYYCSSYVGGNTWVF